MYHYGLFGLPLPDGCKTTTTHLIVPPSPHTHSTTFPPPAAKGICKLSMFHKASKLLDSALPKEAPSTNALVGSPSARRLVKKGSLSSFLSSKASTTFGSSKMFTFSSTSEAADSIAVADVYPVRASPKKVTPKKSLDALLSLSTLHARSSSPSTPTSPIEKEPIPGSPIRNASPLKVGSPVKNKWRSPKQMRRPAKPVNKPRLRRLGSPLPVSIRFASVPYLLGYSPVSLENDFHTSELLKQLYPAASPTFHQFSPGQTPQDVLDLGCGRRATWVIEAATLWRDATVTGFDLVDPEHSCVDSSVSSNITFIKGNFLMRLPFVDQCFDFVRMANLNLCIPQARWSAVLKEAHRVLRPGGVLEVVDEDLVWPYRRPVSLSPVAWRFGSCCERDFFDTESDIAAQRTVLLQTSYSSGYAEYDRGFAVSNAMEGLFEKMIWFKHGINPRPLKFISKQIANIFGEDNGSSSFRTFKVALPQAKIYNQEQQAKVETKVEKHGFGWSIGIEREKKKLEEEIVPDSRIHSLPITITSKAAQGGAVRTHVGDKRNINGLLLYTKNKDAEDDSQIPDKFAFMDATQLEMAICRGVHVLLSCKKALMEYICEIQGEEDALTEMELTSALWTYECFRRMRFDLASTPHGLEMHESEELYKTSGFRSSTDSIDSGYASGNSPSNIEQSNQLVIDPQELQGNTCVRIIRVFNSTKAENPIF